MNGRDEKQGIGSSTGSPSFSGSVSSGFSGDYKTGSGARIDGADVDQVRIDFESLSELAMANLNHRIEELYRWNQSTISETQNKTIKLLDKSSEVLSESAALLAENKAALEESKKLQEQLATEVGLIKGSAVSALAIFVSFFAFITVSINVFSKATDVFSGAALVAVFWFLLLGFNILIGIQVGAFPSRRLSLLWVFLSVAFSFGVVALLYFYHSDGGAISPITIKT